MSILKHEGQVEVPEVTSQQSSHHRRGLIIAAAVGAPALAVGGVGAGLALGASGGHAEATSNKPVHHNLAITDDVCSALKGLLNRDITLGNSTGRVTFAGCSDPNTKDEEVNLSGGVYGDKGGFRVSVNVFGDLESSAEPVSQASADGYTEYLGGFNLASQKLMYGSVVPITVNGVEAYYETQGKDLGGQEYGTAVLMTDGNDDISVQTGGSSLSADTLKAIAGEVESVIFVPATS